MSEEKILDLLEQCVDNVNYKLSQVAGDSRSLKFDKEDTYEIFGIKKVNIDLSTWIGNEGYLVVNLDSSESVLESLNSKEIRTLHSSEKNNIVAVQHELALQNTFKDVTKSLAKEFGELSGLEVDKEEQKDNLVINIFGAPGVGKTTLALNLKDYMNRDEFNYNAHVIPEYAQTLINMNMEYKLKDQIDVTSHQIEITKGVLKLYSNLAISESPIELGKIYCRNLSQMQELKEMISECNTHYKSINLFMNHTESSETDYTTDGRVHSLADSIFLEKEMKSVFKDIDFIFINRNMNVESVFEKIKESQIWKNFEKSSLDKDEKISVSPTGKVSMSKGKADALIAKMGGSQEKEVER